MKMWEHLRTARLAVRSGLHERSQVGKAVKVGGGGTVHARAMKYGFHARWPLPGAPSSLRWHREHHATNRSPKFTTKDTIRNAVAAVLVEGFMSKGVSMSDAHSISTPGCETQVLVGTGTRTTQP